MSTACLFVFGDIFDATQLLIVVTAILSNHCASSMMSLDW